MDTNIREAVFPHGFGTPGDGVKKRVGAGDSISDVIAKIFEVLVSLCVGQRGVDELCGGRFVGVDNTLSNTQAFEEGSKHKHGDSAKKEMQCILLISI
jgi:hypothetical protein